jgi:acetyltransferase-like isoleucine patch superfamily enzyme
MSLKRLLLILCTFAPSSLRLLVWRILGFKIGRGCHVSPCSLIVADEIELGPGAVIGPFTLIYCPSRLRMGERSRIASFVRIIGYGELDLDRQTFVALGCLIDVARGYKFRAGARSQIGPRGTFYTHGACGLLFNKGYPFRMGSILIGEDTWISMACVIYPRVTVGSGCVILPGSILNGDVKDNLVIAPGSRPLPAEIITGSLKDPAAAKLEVMAEFLGVLALTLPGGRAEKNPTESILHLPGNRRVILILAGNRPEPISGDAVIWSLNRIDTGQTPCFAFTELTIYGPWTPLAETIANHLSTQCGTHFVFNS